MVRPAQCLQISKALLWSPLQVSCPLMPGLSLSCLPCPPLFVANENEDCSALTNEIIVTMHTFQDVSWS